jgi:hypothetical protein
MPQPKQHASAAARQAAFRARRAQVRQAELAAQGLPPLPAISSMPGWSRWTAAFSMARELIATNLSQMQDYHDDRSEQWQESDRGEAHRETITATENLLEALDDILM